MSLIIKYSVRIQHKNCTRYQCINHDIIAENIADDADYRKKIKSFCFREAVIASKAAKEEEKSPYEMYYDFKEAILRIPSHRILAINRGENEEFLKVKVEKPEEKILDYLKKIPFLFNI